MSLVYWDTMLFIYWFEDHPTYGGRVRTIFARMQERGDQLCTSAFTVGEVLTGPYKSGNKELASRIRESLRAPHIRILPFGEETADRYARVRSGHTVSPADAIQLAAASEAGVDLFLTHDRKLPGKVVPGIQFIAGLDVNLY